MFSEKLLGYFCDKDLRKLCWWFCLGWQNSGSPAAARRRCFHMQKSREVVELYGRFMGGSDRNTSNSGRFGQSRHFMQIVQSRINTGYFASC